MAGSQLEAKGLLAGLFDFDFSTFITLKFLRVIYAVLMALILLAGIGFFLSIASRGALAALLALIFVPLVTLLYLIFARVSMELIAMFFRLGENTSLLVAQSGGQPPAGPWGGPSPGPAGGPPPSGYGYGGPPQA